MTREIKALLTCWISTRQLLSGNVSKATPRKIAFTYIRNSPDSAQSNRGSAIAKQSGEIEVSR